MAELDLKNWTVERWLLVLTFVASMFTTAFTVGVNYERLNAIGARVSYIESRYLPREIYDHDQETLQKTLERLDQTLVRIEDKKNGQ